MRGAEFVTENFSLIFLIGILIACIVIFIEIGG